MTIISLTFLFVWLLTALFALAQLRSQRKASRELQEIATVIAETASATAQHAVDLNLHTAVKGKIRPFLEEADLLEGLSSEQRHYTTILTFLKEHPGVSVHSAELAIAALRKEANG